MSDLRDVFTHVYETNAWGSSESRSGPGSTLLAARNAEAALRYVVRAYEVHSIIDAPCGDMNWMRRALIGLGVRYLGVDIVPEIIEKNAAKFSSQRALFACADVTAEMPWCADMILCRDLLGHLPLDAGMKVIENFRRPPGQYLLATTFPGEQNIDCAAGGWRMVNLAAAPFDLGQPIELFNEGEAPPHEHKSLGLWRL